MSPEVTAYITDGLALLDLEICTNIGLVYEGHFTPVSNTVSLDRCFSSLRTTIGLRIRISVDEEINYGDEITIQWSVRMLVGQQSGSTCLIVLRHILEKAFEFFDDIATRRAGVDDSDFKSSSRVMGEGDY